MENYKRVIRSILLSAFSSEELILIFHKMLRPVWAALIDFVNNELGKSNYPPCHFQMSAHELELYGTLFFNNGKWRAKQIISKDWITTSTKPYSVTNPRIGTGMHIMAMYPESEFMMVHRDDTDQVYSTTPERLYKIISLVFNAQLTNPNN